MSRLCRVFYAEAFLLLAYKDLFKVNGGVDQTYCLKMCSVSPLIFFFGVIITNSCCLIIYCILNMCPLFDHFIKCGITFFIFSFPVIWTFLLLHSLYSFSGFFLFAVKLPTFNQKYYFTIFGLS